MNQVGNDPSPNDRLPILGVAVLVVVIDQLTKALCVAWMPLHARRPIIDGYLALTHVRNRGMAFGLFGGTDGDWVRWVLVALALAAVSIIWIYARQERAHMPVLIAFGAILGGAVGNLIDRVRLGYVVDFILAHWGSYEWPAFNVADSAITIGGVVLFLALATERTDAEPEHTDTTDIDTPAPSAGGDRDPA